MNKEKIKQRMHEIKSKMRIIEWDKGRNIALSKDRIYEELKGEHERLQKKLKNEV